MIKALREVSARLALLAFCVLFAACKSSSTNETLPSGQDSASASETVHAQEEPPSGGDILWSTDQVAGGSLFSSPAVGEDGTIYIPSVSGFTEISLSAFTPEGELKWVTDELSGKSCMSSPAFGPDGMIYVGSYSEVMSGPEGEAEGEAFLDALTPDGDLKWSIDILGGSNVTSSPVIGADGTIYIGSQGGGKAFLNAITPDGELKWSVSDLGGTHLSSSPVLGNDGMIYVGSHDGKDGAFLNALTPEGQLRWTNTELGGNMVRSPILGADGVVYIGSYDTNNAYLNAITAEGELKWSCGDLGGGIVSDSPALGADGTIYIGSFANHQAFLNAVTPGGEVLWSIEELFKGPVDSGRRFSTSPVVGEGGTVYISTSVYPPDGQLFISSVSPDGTVNWVNAELPGTFGSPGLALSSDGTVYMGAYGENKAYIHAIR